MNNKKRDEEDLEHQHEAIPSDSPDYSAEESIPKGENVTYRNSDET